LESRRKKLNAYFEAIGDDEAVSTNPDVLDFFLGMQTKSRRVKRGETRGDAFVVIY
jgi:hypothetical protein